jgi:hypothetical protein
VDETIKFYVTTGLSLVTIVVLIFTWIAAWKQAEAAKKLTEATQQQIQTGKEQAAAAKEQVNAAKRQITESLRPILTGEITHTSNTANGSVCSVKMKNEGAGVALDVWWAYGRPGQIPTKRTKVGVGIIVPGSENSFSARESMMVSTGLLIVYESLSGLVSGTGINWTGEDYVLTYFSDIGEWAATLLGKKFGDAR